MDVFLRKDADAIISASLRAVLPDEAVHRALRPSSHGAGGSCWLRRQAAWQMAQAAVETLGRVDGGVVITKYGHVKGRTARRDLLRGGPPGPRRERLWPPPNKRWRWCVG